LGGGAVFSINPNRCNRLSSFDVWASSSIPAASASWRLVDPGRSRIA
jgi:hypothetical protein